MIYESNWHCPPCRRPVIYHINIFQLVLQGVCSLAERVAAQWNSLRNYYFVKAFRETQLRELMFSYT